MKALDVTAPGKLFLLLAIVIGAFVALIADALTETTFVAIVGPIAGYLVGNGVGAARGEPSVPIFTPSARDQAGPTPGD